MICKLAQYPLLRCKHPAAPILFLPEYLYLVYVGRWFVNLANMPCLDVSSLNYISYYLLNIQYLLPRWMISKLGQCVLLRCKHP